LLEWAIADGAEEWPLVGLILGGAFLASREMIGNEAHCQSEPLEGKNWILSRIGLATESKLIEVRAKQVYVLT
jgi:hypothetical protein